MAKRRKKKSKGLKAACRPGEGWRACANRLYPETDWSDKAIQRSGETGRHIKKSRAKSRARRSSIDGELIASVVVLGVVVVGTLGVGAYLYFRRQ